MSHAEIWDDSALVESWDEAVAEYKRYHSIHARGEKVEDVLKQHEDEANGQSHAQEDAAKAEDEVEDGTIVEDQQEAAISTPMVKESATRNTSTTDQQQAPTAPPSLAPPLPPHLVGAVQDEALKNLLMSWYYAGYYTGLYEGQRKGQEDAKSTETSSTQ